jgi:hypothetical protein
MRVALVIMAIVTLAAVTWALWTQNQMAALTKGTPPPTEVASTIDTGAAPPSASIPAAAQTTPAVAPPTTATPEQAARAEEIARLIQARDDALAAAKRAQDQMPAAERARTTTAAASTPAPTTTSSSASTVSSRIRAVTSSDWSVFHDALSAIMTGAYDANGSGEIDTSAEVSSVPCDVARALNASLVGFHDSGDISMRPIYGFAEGYGWVGHTIGYAESVRSAADRHFAGCGISG